MNMTTKGLLMAGAMALVPATALAQATGAPATSTTPTTPAAATAPATGAAGIAQGAKVLDTSGGTVGTIESVDGDFAVVATSKSKVRLPKTSFALGPNGPVIGMTASQLDDAAAKAAPQQTAAAPVKANVVKGAAVADTSGGAVGTIADVDGQFATLTLTTGSKVRLPVTAFGAGDNGALKIAMTAAQLTAAAGAAPASTGGVH